MVLSWLYTGLKTSKLQWCHHQIKGSQLGQFQLGLHHLVRLPSSSSSSLTFSISPMALGIRIFDPGGHNNSANRQMAAP
eukprot:c28448_g1_i1 orf=467-703(+)